MTTKHSTATPYSCEAEELESLREQLIVAESDRTKLVEALRKSNDALGNALDFLPILDEEFQPSLVSYNKACALLRELGEAE